MDTFSVTPADIDEFAAKLYQFYPPWFGEEHPVLAAFLQGYASMFAWIRLVLEYVKLQLRIQTATGENLDLIACDFFGPYVQRSPNMNDDAFRRYIQATLFAEMGTVKGMMDAIFNLTGYYPLIIEGFSLDLGDFYNEDFYYNADSYYTARAPYQFWITVYIKNTANVLGGYNTPQYYYNVQEPDGNFYYLDTSEYVYEYELILNLINRVKVGGTLAHLTLSYI